MKKIKFLVLSMILLVMTAIPVFAGTATSSTLYATVNGRQYKYYTKCYTGSGWSNANATVGTVTSSPTVPAGYLGVNAKLYKTNGSLVSSSGWYYSNGPSLLFGMPSPKYYAKGNYYARSSVRIYNGSNYNTYNTAQTPNMSVASIMEENELKIAQINENGEAYGSQLYCDEHLDLIAATGENGIEGYVKATDLDPEPTGLVVEPYNPLTYYIPLYSSDGETVIGSFKISCTAEKPEIQ